jgi:hypothetical protein
VRAAALIILEGLFDNADFLPSLELSAQRFSPRIVEFLCGKDPSIPPLAANIHSSNTYCHHSVGCATLEWFISIRWNPKLLEAEMMTQVFSYAVGRPEVCKLVGRFVSQTYYGSKTREIN